MAREGASWCTERGMGFNRAHHRCSENNRVPGGAPAHTCKARRTYRDRSPKQVSVWSYSMRPILCFIARHACWMFLERILLFVCWNKTGNVLKTLLRFRMMNNLYSMHNNFRNHTCATTPLNKHAWSKWGQSTAVPQRHLGTAIDTDHTGLVRSHFSFLWLLNVHNQTHRQQLQEVIAQSIKYTALGMTWKAETQANEPTTKPNPFP